MLTKNQKCIILKLQELKLLTQGQVKGAIHTDCWTSSVEKAYKKALKDKLITEPKAYDGLDSNNVSKTQQKTDEKASITTDTMSKSTKQTSSKPQSRKKCDISGMSKVFINNAKNEWNKFKKCPLVVAVTVGLSVSVAVLLIEHYSRPTLPKNGVEFSLQRIERKLIEIEEKKSPILKDYKELAALRTELARVHELERLKVTHKGHAVKKCIQAVNQNEKLQAFQAQLAISNCIEQLSK